MFIISKRNLMIQRPGENPYIIRKDYVGEIPEDIASHWLVRAAINDGTIATPQGKKDVDLENADQGSRNSYHETMAVPAFCVRIKCYLRFD